MVIKVDLPVFLTNMILRPLQLIVIKLELIISLDPVRQRKNSNSLGYMVPGSLSVLTRISLPQTHKSVV